MNEWMNEWVWCNAVASRADELRLVRESVRAVRDVLVSVNAQVDEREKQLKLADIYDRLDARSAAPLLNANTFTVSRCIVDNL